MPREDLERYRNQLGEILDDLTNGGTAMDKLQAQMRADGVRCRRIDQLARALGRLTERAYSVDYSMREPDPPKRKKGLAMAHISTNAHRCSRLDIYTGNIATAASTARRYLQQTWGVVLTHEEATKVVEELRKHKRRISNRAKAVTL